MNVVLWVLQVVLAALFAIAGVMKATQPKAKLAQRLPWAEEFSPATVRFIGVMELLGAARLILPAVTGNEQGHQPCGRLSGRAAGATATPPIGLEGSGITAT